MLPIPPGSRTNNTSELPSAVQAVSSPEPEGGFVRLAVEVFQLDHFFAPFL